MPVAEKNLPKYAAKSVALIISFCYICIVCEQDNSIKFNIRLRTTQTSA